MFPARLACVILLALTSSAIGAEQRAAADKPAEPEGGRNAASGVPDFLEYTPAGDGQCKRLLLSAEGATRIDLRRSDGDRQRVFTVLVPADGKEIERLIRAADAIIESGVGYPIDESNIYLDYGGLGTIRCRKGDHDRTVWINKSSEGAYFVWEGVRKGIENVGFLELALAVDEYQNAELRAGKGDRGRAAEQYDNALKRFISWARSRHGRFPGWIYEPSIQLRLESPSGMQLQTRVPAERVLESIAAYSEELRVLDSPEEALVRAWQKCNGGMTLSQSGEAVVVAFPEAAGPIDWTGLSVTKIPDGLIERLKQEPD